MDSDQSKPEVWRPKPRDDKRKIIPEEKPESTVFSAELLALKRIMDAKLKCQHERDHKLQQRTWMVNTLETSAKRRLSQSNGRSVRPAICKSDHNFNT